MSDSDDESGESPPPRRFLPQSYKPSQHDVICGWARQYNHKPGNMHFSELCREAVPMYKANDSKSARGAVIQSVVTKIRSIAPDGGFIKKDERTGLWYDIGDERARDKTGHAIRCLIAQEKRERRRKRMAEESPRSEMLSASVSKSPSYGENTPHQTSSSVLIHPDSTSGSKGAINLSGEAGSSRRLTTITVPAGSIVTTPDGEKIIVPEPAAPVQPLLGSGLDIGHSARSHGLYAEHAALLNPSLGGYGAGIDALSALAARRRMLHSAMAVPPPHAYGNPGLYPQPLAVQSHGMGGGLPLDLHQDSLRYEQSNRFDSRSEYAAGRYAEDEYGRPMFDAGHGTPLAKKRAF